MHPDTPYFSILLCLTPDDFTCQVESAATHLHYAQFFKIYLISSIDFWGPWKYLSLQEIQYYVKQ
jgi:hypothetical protein